MSTASLYCDDKITLNQHDEFTLFLGCEEISRKTSLVDMSALDINSTPRGCHLYCVKDCLANIYIQNVIKADALPKFDRDDFCFYLINKKEESSKVSSVVSGSKPDYVEKMPFWQQTLVFTLIVQRVFSFSATAFSFFFALIFVQIFLYLCIKVFLDHWSMLVFIKRVVLKGFV
jgi:hypothetical protein